MNFKIREARAEDCTDIQRLIMELAVYEKSADSLKISHLGKGIGKALMASVAKVCVEHQCARLNFSVLDWNKLALDFYMSKGAQDLTNNEGWHLLRFDGESLHKVAKEVITLSSSQSTSPVTSTVPSASTTLQPLVKLEPGVTGLAGSMTGARPVQKYIVVSLPSSSSSLEKSNLSPISTETKIEHLDPPS